jgi:hypothetical protein
MKNTFYSGKVFAREFYALRLGNPGLERTHKRVPHKLQNFELGWMGFPQFGQYADGRPLVCCDG